MKHFTYIFLSLFYLSLSSQVSDSSVIKKPVKKKAFMAGDIILNANYGIPQVSAFVIRTGIKIYEKLEPDQTTSFSVTNSGVFNAKAEYGLMESLGLGFAVSYWDMNVIMQNNYTLNNTNYLDELSLKWKVLGIGLRGNYHLVEEMETKLLDPYVGFTLGATKYTKDLVWTSTNPDRQIPDEIPPRLYKLKSGWATYISSTLGVRFYPVRYVGLNVEVGWDKGALFFAGAVIKIPSKPIKSFQD